MRLCIYIIKYIMVLDYSTPDITKNNKRVRGKFSLCETNPDSTNPMRKEFFSPITQYFNRARP